VKRAFRNGRAITDSGVPVSRRILSVGTCPSFDISINTDDAEKWLAEHRPELLS
jgi:hypothetical protein